MTLWQFILSHQYAFGIGSLWVFSAAVSSMPTPTDKSGPGYVWFYGFTHAIAGNLNNVLATRKPNGAPPQP